MNVPMAAVSRQPCGVWQELPAPLPRRIVRQAASGTAEVDLASAIERLGGNAEVYRSLFPGLRKDAAGLVTLATTLLLEGLRPEAQLMLRTLRGIADTLGAFALGRLAAQGESLMAAAPSDEDAHLVAQINLALIRSSIQLERALRAGHAGAQRPFQPDPGPAPANGAEVAPCRLARRTVALQ